MLQPPVRVSEAERSLAAQLGDCSLGRPCSVLEVAPSTMDEAHRLARDGAAHGTCVVARQQTAGRGRAGRTWSSPPGGAYLSLILRPTRPLHELPQLALLAGLAVAKTIESLTRLPASLRWPNDVLIGGRKLAGVLTESSDDARGGRYVVVGIGINVVAPAAALPPAAASLAGLAGAAPDATALTVAVLRELEALYRAWQAEGFAVIRPQLVQRVGAFGKLVHIATARERFEGQAIDIDETGRLLVRLDSGLVRPVDVGDVTLLRGHD